MIILTLLFFNMPDQCEKIDVLKVLCLQIE
jgi:hypothetical protein